MNLSIQDKCSHSENYSIAKKSINTLLLPEFPIDDINASTSSPILDINKQFYKKRVKSPTASTIAYSEALNDTLKESRKGQIDLYNSNLLKLRSNPQINDLITEYNAKIDTLYPKTKELREVLIAENRFAVGKVKHKLTNLQKLKFVLKYMY